MVEDVWFEPRLSWSAAAALVHEGVVLDAERCRRESSDFFELLHVVAGVGHRHGNAVRDIDDLDVLARVSGKLGKSFAQAVFSCLKKSWVIEEDAELIDLRCAFAYFRLRACDVFAVLTTSGIRTVGRSHKRKRSFDAVAFHLAQSVGEHRMPIAISPIDGKIRTVVSKFVLDGCDQITCLLVNRAFAVEVVIVFGNGEHAFARDVASAKHVFEEGDDMVMTFRTAERNHQECVVVHAVAPNGSDEFFTKKNFAEGRKSKV